MKEITKTVYVSDDGEEFDSEKKCVEYENKTRFERVISEKFGEYKKEFDNLVKNISECCRSFNSNKERSIACKYCPFNYADNDYECTSCMLNEIL
jgi:hypothetical protein